MISPRNIFIVCLAAGVSFLGCMELAGGAGGETTNGQVTGQVIFPDNQPASNVRVRLLPAQYDPVKDTLPVSIDTTGDDGRYVISNVDSGEYTLQAIYDKDRTMAMEPGIVVGEEKVSVEALALLPSGTIRIMLSPGVDIRSTYVYIPGTMVYAYPDTADGYVTLDSVPAGIIPAISYASGTGNVAGIVAEDVTVQPGTTLTIPYPDWIHSRKLYFNTTASGAGITGDVHQFPVLIRLSGTTFDFSQACDNGSDIRFTDADNNILPFEIERWDSMAGRAEIWVKAATVFGNCDTQYITMHWGNPGAISLSNGSAVFDTGNAFCGVWHLGENGDTLHDASANRFGGSRNGRQTVVESAIGYGQSYVDSGAFSDMGGILNPMSSGFTVSAWIKRADTGDVYTIIGKSGGDTVVSPTYGWLVTLNRDYLRVYAASGTGGTFATAGEGTYWSESSVRITDTAAWHYVCVTIDRTNNADCRLFIDGVDVTKSRNGDITRVGVLTNTLPLRIGCEADNGYPNRGYVDEATVSFAPRSPDWVRLCYMNQRPDDKLIIFSETK